MLTENMCPVSSGQVDCSALGDLFSFASEAMSGLPVVSWPEIYIFFKEFGRQFDTKMVKSNN